MAAVSDPTNPTNMFPYLLKDSSVRSLARSLMISPRKKEDDPLHPEACDAFLFVP